MSKMGPYMPLENFANKHVKQRLFLTLKSEAYQNYGGTWAVE